MKTYLYSIFVILLIGYACSTPTVQKVNADPLQSWNNTTLKAKIIEFVEQVTDTDSVDFVPIENRIAVFDNDGTLWTEKPLYIPLFYEIDYLKKVVPENPEMAKNKLYNELSKGNLSVLKDYGSFDLIHALFAAHDGQPEDDYEASVYSFLTNEKHAKFNKPYKELVFQPMVELVHFLQANDFKVFIVTGGEISFVRTISEEIYNISEENVIGSNIQYLYESDTSGVQIVRTGKIVSANDKHIKPANIELHIGKKPIFGAGNSDGDYEMMEYTLSGEGPSMAILVHHDDAEREYSYMHGTENAVADAEKKGWHVVSMKNDFKQIFPE